MIAGLPICGARAPSVPVPVGLTVAEGLTVSVAVVIGYVIEAEPKIWHQDIIVCTHMYVCVYIVHICTKYIYDTFGSDFNLAVWKF